MASSSTRSDLIDATFHSLYTQLSNPSESTSSEQIVQSLQFRLSKLKNCTEPYGKPNEASRAKVETGSVKLDDGSTINVEDEDKTYVWAISERFGIDEVDALVTLRSFLYNEGLPDRVMGEEKDTLIADLLEAITPFHFEERLSILRLFIPLFRGYENPLDPVHEIAQKILPDILDVPSKFPHTLTEQYLRRGTQELPPKLLSNPRSASRIAKQNLREQLSLLEVLFWSIWSYVPCDGPLTLAIFDAGYKSDLGAVQKNATLLLDEEGSRILHDIESIWILLFIETLNLEKVTDDEIHDIGGFTLTTDPKVVVDIHNRVMSNLDPRYSPVILAWATMLQRFFSSMKDLADLPPKYKPILHIIQPPVNSHTTKIPERIFKSMIDYATRHDVLCFERLQALVSSSPLFNTAAAWSSNSALADPNAIAYRSVLKGLLIATSELVQLEYLPNPSLFLELWMTLFGNGEGQSVAPLCRQYWDFDYKVNASRRAILDMTRAYFPVYINPIVRLLRSMAGSGSLPVEIGVDAADEDGAVCSSYVFHYLRELQSFTVIASAAQLSGPEALYQKRSDGRSYTNTKSMRLPGGSMLPLHSVGTILTQSSAPDEGIAISWEHTHSGWSLLLDILRGYVKHRTGALRVAHGVPVNRPSSKVINFTLADIGIQSAAESEETVTNILDLIRTVVQNKVDIAAQLIESLEDSIGESTAQGADLVELTTSILEDSLRQSSQSRRAPPIRLIVSAISVLSSLLPLPSFSSRVWLYLRTSTVLLGSSRGSTSTPANLVMERASGTYTITLSVLDLVRALFDEALASLLVSESSLSIKLEILRRAVVFVHTEIWIGHSGWKYSQLGDRFDISRKVSSLYADILRNASISSGVSTGPFAELANFIVDNFIYHGTSSSVNPLVSSLANGRELLFRLFRERRYSDARRFVQLLESHLLLTRTLLSRKLAAPANARLTLLEQLLCSSSPIASSSISRPRFTIEPIDTIASYTWDRALGRTAPLEAIKLVTALCDSLARLQPPQSIVSHLAEAETTAAKLIRIARHPYDDLALRDAVWDFINLAVETQPAFSSFFITGRSAIPRSIADNEETEKKGTKRVTALSVARETIEGWKNLWEFNPHVLASAVRFLDIAWQHFSDHSDSLNVVRKDGNFWKSLIALANEELGPAPDCVIGDEIQIDGEIHSNLHDAVATYSYRATAKAKALHLLSVEIQEAAPLEGGDSPSSVVILELLRKEDVLTEHLMEAVSTSFKPDLHSSLMDDLDTFFPAIALESLNLRDSPSDRGFGDDYLYFIRDVRRRTRTLLSSEHHLTAKVEQVIYATYSINLNWSLADSQIALTKSWSDLLSSVISTARKDSKIRENALTLAKSISNIISSETRAGIVMQNVHSERLKILLALLQIAWFGKPLSKTEIVHFVEMAGHLAEIITSEIFPPNASFARDCKAPFHRTLLQILFYVAKRGRELNSGNDHMKTDDRMTLAKSVHVGLLLVIDGLCGLFDIIKVDDSDMLQHELNLFISVFHECTRMELDLPPSLWLSKCLELGLIRISVELLALLFARNGVQPDRILPLLSFYMTIVEYPSAAERLATEGIMAACSRLSADAPSEVWCSVISIVSSLIASIGSRGTFVELDLCAFIEVHGERIGQAFAWTVDETLSSSTVDEMQRLSEMFRLMAEACSAGFRRDTTPMNILRAFCEPALTFLQQLNYAFTHPNHLASLLEISGTLDPPKTGDGLSPSTTHSLADLLDVSKRPVESRYIYRLLLTASNLVATLSTISGSQGILSREELERKDLTITLLVPHIKVNLSEPASLGTISELASRACDMLEATVRLSNSAPTTNANRTTPSLDTNKIKSAAQHMAEASLIFIATQTVAWLSKSLSEHSGNMDVEELGMQESTGHHDGRLRQTISADRARRNMTGELVGEIVSLMTRCQATLEKSGVTKSENIALLLKTFLEDRASAYL
ncbi:hypothetical protein SISSUDRAFT_1059148 [Sistotremastrum suecicum HHB10207 ss-3]|uniref:Nucleoporin Nup188 N-terminal subdomain III domain-containing protein n=1 Tax=Sistotremastrum suecicum HHB10207 ss-3 TaxID=1314776 RepID=A0A166GMT9_9AGAM|nr:hypothetical protein SISSUDRAFT_1059148 [Sistotremastrum suecicum HHB10207 ss-3]